MSTYIVTSAPPNPNGDLHLGHLSGPFLGADVLTRHLRQRGHHVRHVGYSDEHSCYVPRRAAEIGATAYETAFRFGNRMEETLSLGAMHHDWFTRPLTNPRHTAVVQEFFTSLWEQDRLVVRNLPVFYCAGCERHLYEAEVRGECQFCGDPSDGVYCEACGLPQEPAGLAAPRCTSCWEEPEQRTLDRICFPLEDYRGQLLDYYERAQAQAEWRPRLTAYLETLLSRELPLTPISRIADYGIPVPLDEWDGHILDTWFSGIFGYTAATACLTEAEGEPELWRRQWTDPETKIVNFIGFDCSFSHAVLWPALLMAQGTLTLPSQIVTNEFYRLEGEKFSTSRNHAVWGGEFLRQVSADALRFHLCLTGPEREQTNFAAKEFADTVETLLVDGLERWAESVLRLLGEDFGSTVPAVAAAQAYTGPLTEVLDGLADEIASTLAAESLSPQVAATALAHAIDRGVDDLPALARSRAAAEHSDDAKDAYARRLVTHVEALALVTSLSAPLMPGWSAFLAPHLGLEVSAVTRMPGWPDRTDGPLVAVGQEITAQPPTFFRQL
ncbi:class I tRNA ligase family protein [Streptomyces sp. NBC_00299]|uniref:class I tRNA ligase family protein n=1 Tax=Streptomyces sp. NBC_00299 TaxID=2975705 RepID=UPI002E2A59D4|nr:class I tRNA ligase family protein [Streptomyces sp. NBC_00299]